ncbi:MAG TPA: ABC transporter substrate-binding protein, partial [Ktedonobacterales bacterium]
MTHGFPHPALPAQPHRPQRIRRALRAVPALTIIPLLAMLLVACGGAANSGSNVLVFGAPVSLTGSTSHEGQDTLNGYQLWAKTVNAKGGIKVGDKTYTVQIKYYDDGSSPTKSAQLTTQLITA